MITTLVFILILSLLIIVHEFGHFIAARRMGVRVEKFSLGFGPNLFKKKKNDTEYIISAIPLGGFVKLAGDTLEGYTGKKDEYYAKPPGARFNIIFFGPLLNYILGFLFFWMIFFIGYPTLTTRVGGLIDGFGAKDVGLQVGDKIVAVDGKRVDYWEDLQGIIYTKKAATKVNLSVLRDNKEFSVDVALKEKELTDQLGQKRNIGLLGITPSGEALEIKHGFFASFVLGAKKTWGLTIMTYKGLWMMVTGKLSVRESITGPLGIFYITSKAAKLGIIAVLHLIAVLSISLAIFNLLPFPVLDGGHILLLGIEKLRKKTLSIKAEDIITRAGLSIIVLLAVLVTFNDIVRLFGDKITKFFK
jgi:regulator of sigma E protease